MQRFFLGLLFVALGSLMLRYTRPVYWLVGKFGWAEKFFGTGGTITALRLIGIAFIFFGLLYAFWLILGS